MSLEEEEETSGYECFFCDKNFDSFERLEEHQEYHLIETEYDKKVEPDAIVTPIPHSCKTFPEITSLLAGSRLPRVNEGFDGSRKQQTKTREACYSVDQNMSVVGVCSTHLEIKHERLNSDSVNRSYIVKEGIMSKKEAMTDEKKVVCTSKYSEIKSQRNSGPREVEQVLVINRPESSSSPDVAVSMLGDCILDERSVRKEGNYNTITMTEKKGATSGCEDVIQLRNGFSIMSDSSSCMATNGNKVVSESNSISQSQKEHAQFFGNTFGDYLDDARQHAKVDPWDRPFKCSVCSITFKKEAHLNSHQSVHSDDRPFGCGFCSKRFKRSDTLAIHERSHTGLKCHTCEICGKSYVSKFVLRRHRAIHSNEKPFACDLCERAFRIKYDLTVHRRRHFDDKPFSCKECGKKFTNSAHVATHMLIHRNQRSFVCSECGKSFLRKEHLSRHLSSVHIGERNYSCDICGKRFKRPEVLKAHSLTHSKKEDFVCGQCGKSYSTKWNLKAHSVRHKIVKKKSQGKSEGPNGGDA